MKYYIVALFDDETYQVISPIQKNMSKKFRASRNSPMPFIPLGIVDNPNLDKLYPIIKKVISPYKSFRIDATDNVYLHDNTKSINLRIENKGYIKRISRSLKDILILNGFNVKAFDDNFISIANMGYIAKDYKKQDVKLNFPTIYKDNSLVKLRIKKIEVWKIPTQKKDVPLKSYILKEF
ncbi:2'-5' RNA ligase family protein [Clostridium sp. CTA-5]